MHAALGSRRKDWDWVGIREICPCGTIYHNDGWLFPWASIL